MARDTETRAAEVRNTETRAATVRTPRVRGIVSLRDIPPEMVPPDQEYTLVNEEVRGERQTRNLDHYMNKGGYRPVLASAVPGYSRFSLDADKPTDDFLREGGQILMGRPKEWGQEDRAEQAAAARQAEADATRKNVVADLDPRNARPDATTTTRVFRENARPQFNDE